jgi:glucose/arabinose dehydrogenase
MLLTLLTLALQSGAAPIPDIEFEVAFPNLKVERCVAIEHPRDGSDRIFILEQPGRVMWFENSAEAKEKKLALDLVPKVRSRGNEEGLLGLAFHPKVKENGFVYLQYSTSDPPKEPDPKKVMNRRNVLSRFKMSADRTTIDPASEQVLLEVKQPYENHNGGVIQFGPDGFLYIGLGDGGAANDPHGNGQKPDTMLGKFLRIDVDRGSDGKKYAVPKDNPFVGKEGILPEIWSIGWRNPWGYHFDRKTGELWSGDVGQDKWEEICIVRKGGNYGWNTREAFHEFRSPKGEPPEFVDPIVEHDHGLAKSITGGCVYHGKKNPAWDGLYLYGDFVTGNMWAIRWDGKKMVENKLIFTLPGKQIAIFGEDRDGEVLFSSFDGRIYRFKPKDKP